MSEDAAKVLLTGASSGFGRLGAEELARRGHTVLATMRDPDGRNRGAKAELLEQAGRNSWALHVLELDVTDEESVRRAVDEAEEVTGGVDVVINNAGYVAIGITEAYSTAQFQDLLNTNLLGVHRVNRAVLPGMRRRERGLLIHVSSGAGRTTPPAVGIYSASKYGMEALAEAYRFELAPFGIDSVVVEPGIYETPTFEKLPEPDDMERIDDYGTRGSFANRVRAAFQGAMNAPDAPSPDEVAEIFADLVEMPRG
ncbi:MAG: SDR family oxidoreductase [Gemmatimonadota bacterium]